ncbi:MAG: hypothetical protein M3Z66_23135 [Chloroflexota bacterium]|nr:hypothetical protein [Chloroflexota bacterium]
MYTTIERRKMNHERLPETMQRAQAEFFPTLQSAPGFVGFYLVADTEKGINSAIVVFEDRAQAEAIGQTASGWMQALDEMGHTVQTRNGGETVVSIDGKR